MLSNEVRVEPSETTEPETSRHLISPTQRSRKSFYRCADKMLNTRPHLTTLRPSPTTVSFTVSTSLPPQSFAASITHWFLLALRILIGILVILVHLAKYLDPAPSVLAFLSDRLNTISWLQIGVASSITLYLVFLRFHTGMSPRSNHLSFLLRSTIDERLQKNLSLSSAPSVSRQAASRLIIFFRLQRASFLPRKSAIYSFTKLFGALR